MSDNIDMSNGQANVAAVGGAGSMWHKKGNEILATDTMSDVARKAGMAHIVTSSPVTYTDGAGIVREMPNTRVNFRADTGAALGIRSDDYKILQPAQVLEFLWDWSKKNNCPVHTAGSLAGGKRVWAMCKLSKEFGFMLPGKDKIDSYLRFMTGFDGKTGTSAVGTSTRQVCENTENLINRTDGKNSYNVSHMAQFDPVALQQALGMMGESHRITSQFWNELCKRKVNDAERDKFFCDLFEIDVAQRDAVDSAGKTIVKTRTRNMLSQLTAAFNNAPGQNLKSAKGTAYGLLQAVTYWTDHESRSNDIHKDGADAARFNSAQFGLGARTKADAQYLAAELAGCLELVVPASQLVAA
jgi:phage/plasmid-like protein (TIGR03299 family)